MFSTRTKPVVKSVAAAIALALASVGAMANSSASFNVTSFATTITGGTISWLPDQTQQTVEAHSSDAGLPGIAHDATASNSAWVASTQSAASPNSTGTASATSIPTSSGSATATTSVVTYPPFELNQGMSAASQSGIFLFSGNGSVTFNIGYSLAVAADSAANGDSAEATLELAVDNYFSSTGLAPASVDLASLVSGTSTTSGFLTMTVNFLDGDYGTFLLSGSADAISPSAVPEPTEAALLMAGLGVIGLMAKRRRRA